MNQETIDLVQQSWRNVTPIAPQAAAMFYDILFTRDPELKPLFRGNMQQQGQKLMQMIDAAVGQLNNLDRLVPILQQLGQRHAAYGVMPAHYETVGAALLDTLARGLGDAFTEPVRTAWASVYGTMAQVMTEAAHRQAEHAVPAEAHTRRDGQRADVAVVMASSSAT